MTKEDLDKAIREFAEAEYLRGFEAGKQALMSSVAQLAAGVMPGSEPKNDNASPDESSHGESAAASPSRPRAARGRTGEVLRQILTKGFPLALSEIQRRALAEDDSLSEKTIHNELYRHPELYERNPSTGKWRWIGPVQQVEGGQQAQQPTMEEMMN